MIGWVVVAVLASLLAGAVGRHYTTTYNLPGTESQRVLDLLRSEFKAQSGDIDTIVFQTTRGSVFSPQVQGAVAPLLTRVGQMPHVVAVISPYSQRGALQVSADRRTAFAQVYYDKTQNLLPNDTGKPVLDAISAVHVPGLKLAAGGAVIENAEGFSIGPATAVGVVAAMVILLITFGSLLAAGMPLITAAFGLVTGVAVIGLATHVVHMPNVSTDLALMIGLGVGIDYALFIVTRFKESHARVGDVHAAIVEAMDTSGRAILLAGTTVVIALLGMFATGVQFMYGLSVASVITVLLVMLASLTLLPALLARWGNRLVTPGRQERRRVARAAPPRESAWRRWSLVVQHRPWPLAIVTLAVMLALVAPVTGLRLANGDAGNDSASTSTRHAFDLLAKGFGPGFNGPLSIVAELHGAGGSSLSAIRAAVTRTPGVVAVTSPRVSPGGAIAMMQAYPSSAPQAPATTDLVHRLRGSVLPPLARHAGVSLLVGGFTAGSVDFANVLAAKLPLFIAIVVVLSALLLLVIFRSLVIPLQAAAMNLLSIGGALGATVLVFQKGFLAGALGVETGPVEPWIPVIIFAVVFGLSMDYEVFLISRVREEWVRRRDASVAVADGIALTGRVISAAAAIMICVFLSFMIGDQRSLKEFGFGLAAAVFLDAIVIRCVMLPAVLELLGAATWKFPRWLDERLPHFNIEGQSARRYGDLAEPGAEEER
ncbi:MAG TPA: MMPL family transporter, partial [Candidatus Limnocylindria bacterium]|nr:MMPL family transporter [Candidatus Limnocylindria bacterium]